MKKINLLASRLPWPTAGPPPDELDFGLPPKGRGRREPFPPILRRGLTLALWMGGLVVAAAGAYHALIRPLDFASMSRLVFPGAERPAVKKPQPPPEPSPVATRRPRPGLPTARARKEGSPSPRAEGVAPEAGSPRRPPRKAPSAPGKPGLPAAALPLTDEKKREPPPVARPKAVRPPSEAPAASGLGAGGARPGQVARAPSKPKPAEPAPSPKEEPAPKSRAKVERVEEPSKGAGGKPSVLSAVTRPQESPSKRPRPSGEVPGPPASPKAAGVPGGRYAVQVAACRRSPCTRRVRAKLKKEGLRSYVTVSKSRKFLLVRVGPYPTFKQARAVLQRLKKKGYKDPFVLKR